MYWIDKGPEMTMGAAHDYLLEDPAHRVVRAGHVLRFSDGGPQVRSLGFGGSWSPLTRWPANGGYKKLYGHARERE
ncbi:hypothetical protein LCGC14_1911560 [marine sediment metagenome]|uniref:Uncharacterized protein n=1 Tax=marine sediment metagenome TaxID=412755 RepID=A0A0F9I7I8_9ZZZZ